jgi:hypothetical protein
MYELIVQQAIAKAFWLGLMVGGILGAAFVLMALLLGKMF